MCPTSRINFAKIYTIQHKVRVYDFGDVDKNFIGILKTQWNYVLDSIAPRTSNAAQASAIRVQTSLAHPTSLYFQASPVDDNENDSADEVEEEEEGSEDGQQHDSDNNLANKMVSLQVGDKKDNLPAYAKALYAWTGNDGQLAFESGHWIYVEKHIDTNWSRGKNYETGEEGIFPRSYINI